MLQPWQVVLILANLAVRLATPVKLGQGQDRSGEDSSEEQEADISGSLAPRVVTRKFIIGCDIWEAIKENVDNAMHIVETWWLLCTV